MLQIGDQFDRYQIQGHIAHGGMSDIYRAYDVMTRQEVALKIPDINMIGDPAQFERFQREKDVLQSLDHPAILRGLGAGTYNRIPYLATELVDGQSLRDYMNQNMPIAPDAALALIKRIADGMAFCHEHGVIHRDLKPENILLRSDGSPVIMDFGLALTKGGHRVTYSNLSATMGTPEYMAPEQVEGKRGDERTDVYALATILYEMLCGQPPFSGDNTLVVMAQRLQTPAPRLDRLAKDVPVELAAVVGRALLRDPDQRYANMRALIEALDNLPSADLSVLDQETGAANPGNWQQAQALKGVLIAVGILIGLVVLAFALQALR